MNFVLEVLASTSVLLFPNNAKRSRRITAHTVLLGSSLKKQEKMQKNTMLRLKFYCQTIHQIVNCDINPWEKSVACDTKMKRLLISS